MQFAQKIARQLAAVIAPLHNGVAQHELKEYRFGEILQRLFVNRRRQLRHVRRLVAAGDDGARAACERVQKGSVEPCEVFAQDAPRGLV